ncbi:MAG: type II secretion system protein [Bdellovibrionales bacterium]|nr:type II secretion system protein [Bdellovibrionales bacterium]
MVKYFASIIRQLDLLRSQRESERKLRNCLYPSCKFEALGFTLIELVVVVAIISIATLLISINSGALAHWEEENFLRRLIETIEFLHSQAIQDGEHYRIEFNFE